MESNQVFVLEEALRRAMGDADFLKMMLDEFQALIPQILTRLEKACKEGDMVTISKEAHQLKGAAANLSAKALAEAALKLEQIGKNAKNYDCTQALAELKRATEIFGEQLNTINWLDVTADPSQQL